MELNNIRKSSIDNLGHHFIKPEHLPKGKDEYYLRNMQNRSGINYRQLTAYEIEALVRNRNTSDDWNKILVSDAFNPELVKGCKFFGLVRIGKLEPYCLEFSDLKLPVGLYNSTIISCDFGDNVVIDNVNYLSNYILGNEVIVVNVNELATSDHAKFGIGIIKDGEPEGVRIWLEICNENGGRSVIPFNGMLPADAYMWSKYRDDEKLLQQFKIFTENQFKKNRGFYGKIGDRTVIKNCAIIKDAWIGSDAYIKGANKLKNVTINSGPEGKTQIGEGCELVNGIVGFGCRVFYGVKAVRFIIASNCQLKYGARLINSYLGNNSTISCCEVLNSLIFPSHEQHHNNSFLCAALIMGQSNIAAGATIGSNHNSRAPDGEFVAGRGFWPGLCVSIKHNTRFASFTILAKADYSYELNIPVPFSLVSNNLVLNRLEVMPAYWFMYNMYALARNSWKYGDRDKKIPPFQLMEYDYLAPDTVNEMFNALEMIALFAGKAFYKKEDSNKTYSHEQYTAKGKEILESGAFADTELEAEGFENSKRPAVLVKAGKAYSIFKQMIQLYGTMHLIALIENNKLNDMDELHHALPGQLVRSNWINTGGQMMRTTDIDDLKKNVKNGKIKSWDQLHAHYEHLGAAYSKHKTIHALAALQEITATRLKKISVENIQQLFNDCLATKQWVADNIYTSRAKDYQNSFRKIVYDNDAEMEAVVGKLSDNSFILQQKNELVAFKKKINKLRKIFTSEVKEHHA